MKTVTVRHEFDVPSDIVRDAMSDIEPFTRAAGFDEVTLDGDRLQVANNVGITTIELTLELLDLPEVDLAYEQVEGIFDEMRTTYTVTETETGSELLAETEFALDVAVIGDVLDATVIKRQRRKELTAQFDWLDEQIEAATNVS